MKWIYGTKPLKNDSGELIFKYSKSTFYIMVLLSILIIFFSTIYDPPTKIFDILMTALIIVAVLVMTVQSLKYYLVLSDNSIIRYSAWPWHTRKIFKLDEMTEVEMEYKMSFFIKMSDGYKLGISTFIMGAFHLLHHVINNSPATVSKDAKKIIDFYSQ
jgi:hypothetical protein